LALLVLLRVTGFVVVEATDSNFDLKEDTFPVTTGDGDLLRRLVFVPVDVLPLNVESSVKPFKPVTELFLLFSTFGLTLLNFENGVVGLLWGLCIPFRFSMVFVTGPGLTWFGGRFTFMLTSTLMLFDWLVEVGLLTQSIFWLVQVVLLRL